MNKKTILSIALVCVLLVSSGAVASGVFSSFAREKAPMEVEEQKISPMTFPPGLPLPPELPPVIPFPPDIPPEIPLPPEMPFPPEEPPEIPDPPKEPSVEIPENITVSMILDQLQNNVTVPKKFEWLKKNMTQCLEDCIEYYYPRELDLTNETDLILFVEFVIEWWNDWLEVYGDGNPLYAQVIEAAIKCLEEWLESPGNLEELIEQFVKCMQTFIEELITIPVPEIPIPPEIPILPGF